MIIEDLRRDPRFAKDLAASTGFVPEGLMAVPLLHEERTLGVLEVLDRPQNASFSLREMDVLALFATQAAVALDIVQRARRARAVAPATTTVLRVTRPLMSSAMTTMRLRPGWIGMPAATQSMCQDWSPRSQARESTRQVMRATPLARPARQRTRRTARSSWTVPVSAAFTPRTRVPAASTASEGGSSSTTPGLLAARIAPAYGV
jgi:hypothetical protein